MNIRALLVLVLLTINACSTSNQSSNSEASNIPANLDAAVSRLKETLPGEDLIKIKSGSERDLASLHHGFGTGLRNSWGLWAGSELSKWFNKNGIYHPDDMSSIIIRSLHRDLKGQPRELHKQIKRYQDYWKRVEEDKKEQARLDLQRAERRKNAMLGWRLMSTDAPEATLPRQPSFGDIWTLEPYNDGFIVVFKKWREAFNSAWHDGVFFLDSPHGELKPIKVNSCNEIHDVVVEDGVASWLCRNTEGWSVVETTPGTKLKKRNLIGAPSSDWLRLGKGKEGLLVVSPDTIYRESAGNLAKLYQASSPYRDYPKFDHDKGSRNDKEYFFSQRSSTPLEYNGAIYFQVENTGNETDIYRLRLSEEDIENFFDIFVYDFIGRWRIYSSNVAIAPDGNLWIGTPEKGTLIKIANNHEIKIASVFENLEYFESIDDRPKPNSWKERLPTGAICFKDSIMYLAGVDGIVKVVKGNISPVAYFTYPDGMARTPYTSRPQYDYHIKPQRLGLFSDGSFAIGDRFDGLYVLLKNDDGYEFRIPAFSDRRYTVE